MNTARRLTEGSVQRQFLAHMIGCGGGWLLGDAWEPDDKTFARLEKLGYCTIERTLSGVIYASTITPLGRAAYAWGTAEYLRGGARR